MSLEESEKKLGRIEKIHANTFEAVGEEIMKIGSVDPLLMVKKEEINAKQHI